MKWEMLLTCIYSAGMKGDHGLAQKHMPQTKYQLLRMTNHAPTALTVNLLMEYKHNTEPNTFGC